jgi:ketosteroid isomerase-like protein
MPGENMENVRRNIEHFQATGDFVDELFAPDFVWDMSQFRGWIEKPLYPGLDGAREFMSNWIDTWDEWESDYTDLREVGDKVFAVVRQRGRAKATGVEVEMTFAQVFSFRDGKQTRMVMYADPDEALEALGR